MNTNTIPTITLQVMGDPNADACEGETCAIPEHHIQIAVNRRIDHDRI